jgi:3-hydroxybutyryl-CoA dehydrogenase
MQIDDVNRALVAGAGTMGTQIALRCALHGLDVAIYDVSHADLEAAPARIRAHADQMVAAGALSSPAAEAAQARIACSENMAEAARGVQLVSESVAEDPQVKGRLYGELDRLCPEDTIFATNSSTLTPSAFASTTGRPDRFCALHSHGPVWYANIADAMPHSGTSGATTTLVEAFARRIGQTPILVGKESGAYVFNAMLDGVLGEALALVANGVASFEDVDRS